MIEILGLIFTFYSIIGFVLAVNKMPKENNPISKIMFSNELNVFGKILSAILAVPIMPLYLFTRFMIFIFTKKERD